ncbi:hypothetical protein HDU86_007365, partial [Geranomyces michiganensis]
MNNFGGKNEYSPSNEKFKDIVDELTPQLVRYQDIADFWPPEIPAAQAANAINYAAAMMLTNVTVAVKMNLAKRIQEYVGVMMRARRSELMIKCLHRKDTPAGLKAAIRRFRAKVRLIEKLAVDPEQALDDPMYFHGNLSSVDIAILESVWEILPERAFHLLMQDSHMVYDIELHPELYFESYVKLGMMMDAARLRGLDARSFNAVPLRTHYYQSYVTIDTVTLSQSILCHGRPKIPNQATKMNIWRQCFNLNHSSFHP